MGETFAAGVHLMAEIDFHVAFLQQLDMIWNQMPMIVLQATDVIGLVAILLVLRRRQLLSIHDTPILGIILGLSSFILTALVSEQIQGRLKLYPTTDVLFIAGLWGGWRNALWAAGLSFAGRALFGGGDYIGAAALDTLIIAVCGVLLHSWLIKRNTLNLNFLLGVKIVLWRFLIVELPLVFFYLFSPEMRDITIVLMAGRFIGSFTFSVLIVFAVFMLFCREQERERTLFTDAFSGFRNRRALQQDLETTYRRRLTRSRVLLFIDIKNFVMLVQELGFAWADDFCRRAGGVLNTLAERPELAAHEPCIYCFTDRSFVLVLQDVSMEDIRERGIATIIYDNLMNSLGYVEHSLRVQLTIGVFNVLPQHTLDPVHFLRTLTIVRHSPEGAVQYFAPDVDSQIQRETQIRQQIDLWIKAGCVPLWMQPKVSLPDGRCVGAEALLRAQKSDGCQEFISPPEVFSIATQYHTLDALEWAVVETVVSYLESMPTEMSDLCLSVNLSPATLSKPGFGQKICDLLERKRIDARRFTVEVVETTRLSASDAAVSDNIDALTRYGIKLSLDDFGTGYSSLSLLSQVPFSELKLDYSMISNMDSPRVNAAILMVVEGVRRYDVSMVAEGIESEEQRRKLLEMGVTVGQGFLFGKAMPFQEFIEYVGMISVDRRVAAS